MKSLGRLASVAALGIGTVLLAGCVSPYNYVRTDGGGGYYTSSGPYAATTGYYGYYAPAPYYYAAPSYYGGYYGGLPGWSWGGYGGWGYGSGFSLGIGYSSGWIYPNYWNPWYATGFPYWWGCRYCHAQRYHQRHDTDNVDTRILWKPGDPHLPVRPANNGAGVVEHPHHPIRVYQQHDFVRAPIGRRGVTSFRAADPRAAYAGGPHAGPPVTYQPRVPAPRRIEVLRNAPPPPRPVARSNFSPAPQPTPQRREHRGDKARIP